tara:strand:- start:12945 stop:13676 length:732 start_codon:yes stop_codon:yes gene_type:complete
MERVTITDQETGPDAPQETIEQPSEAQETVQEELQEQTDRPEWLQEKFSSPEELARAYSSLEKEFSSRQAEEKGLLTDADFQKYGNEYAEQGGLSEDTYKALADKGLSKELVDNYIQGQQLLQSQEEQELFGVAGGQEQYDQMAAWMTENLDQEDIDTFNEAVQGDNVSLGKMAIKGMYAQFVSAGGASQTSEPNLIQGGKPQNVGGYGSNYEMMQDMKDPRYKAGDKTFHAMVEKRLSRTNL